VSAKSGTREEESWVVRMRIGITLWWMLLSGLYGEGLGEEFEAGTGQRPGVRRSQSKYAERSVGSAVFVAQRGRTYVMNPVSSQHMPTIHPRVLSPRTARQSRMREGVKLWPRTRVVKRMRMREVA
jgi:hypothetical protein